VKGTGEKQAFIYFAAPERNSAELQFFCEHAAVMRESAAVPRSDFYSPFSISL
jgi:hypothetical protein